MNLNINNYNHCQIPEYGQCVQCHKCYVLAALDGSMMDRKILHDIYSPILEKFVMYHENIDLSSDEQLVFVRKFIDRCIQDYNVKGSKSFFDFFREKMKKIQIVTCRNIGEKVRVPEEKEFNTVGPILDILSHIEKQVFYMRYFQSAEIVSISNALKKDSDDVVAILNTATEKLNNFF